jgi:cell division protein FtsI (penicillin-binding protein 3)
MTLSGRRTIQLSALLAAWGIIVVGRLVQIQIVRHSDYVERARRQQERTIALSPTRGSILDARGRVLAESVSADSVYADPQVIGDPARVARQIAGVAELALQAKQVERLLRLDGGFVWIARRISAEASAALHRMAIPGIYFLEEHRRSYPRDALASSVIGYVGSDGEGLSGVEHSLNHFIRGRAGRVTVLRDARRATYLVGGEGANRAVDGDSVVLTIDEVIQYIAERALERAVDRYRAAGATAIVMDPGDGAILALASLPTFDPNHYQDYPPEQWKNRAVQDLYEPGSTFKIITASAGLEEGVVTPSQMVDCGMGKISFGNVDIHEHGGNRYGMMTFEDVLVHSSNVGAARVGLALGPQRFYRYIRLFGFGQRTGVQLPGEGVGMLRRAEKWSALTNAEVSMGQEIAVTPLQIARAVATVANGGLRVDPRIVDRVVDASGAVVYRPPAQNPVRVISEKTAAVLNEILKQVVARGTGQPASLAEQVVAGKTGTAQKPARGGYSPDKFVASFAGYVPADRPRLVIVVVVDEPKGSQYGGTVAAPVFHEIAESALRYLGVAPSLPARRVRLPQPMLATFSQRNSPGIDTTKPTPDPTAGTPDLRGLDARAAIFAAMSRGLSVRTIGSGVVDSQSPAPGALVPENRQMIVNLSPRVEAAR